MGKASESKESSEVETVPAKKAKKAADSSSESSSLSSEDDKRPAKKSAPGKKPAKDDSSSEEDSSSSSESSSEEEAPKMEKGKGKATVKPASNDDSFSDESSDESSDEARKEGSSDASYSSSSEHEEKPRAKATKAAAKKTDSSDESGVESDGELSSSEEVNPAAWKAEKMTDDADSDSEDEEKKRAATRKESGKQKREEAVTPSFKKAKTDDSSEDKRVFGATEDDVQDLRDVNAVDSNQTPLWSAIVKGTGSLAESDMPFVNRLEELSQVFVVNAENIIEIINSNDELTNYRLLRLLFCVQYFGSGKTTLGKQFPQKVQTDTDFQGFILNKLEKRLDLSPEWQWLQDHGIGRLYIDVGCAENIVLEAATVAAGGKHVRTGLSFNDAAQQLVSYASTHGPTLFHFDEVGAMEEHNLDELRFLVRGVWKQMREIKNTEGAESMPRVYFLVTGKSTVPFQNIGGGTQFSPCGSHFLVLDMLSSKYIGEVRRHMMGLEHNPLKFNHLRETDTDYLDQCLAGATGGAPRLLLYALRALHYLQPALDSRDKIDKAINDDVFGLLMRVPTVYTEFFPVDDAHELACFRVLLSLSLSRDRLTFDTKICVGKRELTIAQMLRFQPFYLSRDGLDMSTFDLHLPLFHLKAAETRFDSNPAQMLLTSMAGAAIRLTDPWRVFELLPAHVVASRAALRAILSPRSSITWAEAFPTLFGGSRIAKKAAFCLGSKPYVIHSNVKPSLILKKAEHYARIGGAVCPVDKSESADLFHVQRRKNGGGLVVFEWQQKLYVAKDVNLTMGIVRDEVQKVNKKRQTVLVMLTTNIGGQLSTAVREENVLILQSWSKTEEAEYAFSKDGTLLWRKSHCDQWFCHPSKQTSYPKSPKNNAAVVVVRPRLEVVIPHVGVVKKLVGEDLFDAILAFAKPPGAAILPSKYNLVAALEEALSSSHSSQAETKHERAAKAQEAEAKAKEAKADVEKAKADVEKAKADVEKAKADGDQDMIDLAKKIYATAIDGLESAQKYLTHCRSVIAGKV